MRERRDDHARPRPRLFVRGVQVREEVLVRAHAHVVHRRAGEDRAPDVDRVRRARHERGVARADEREHQVREAFLGADRRAHLGLEVERRRRTCAGTGRRPPCAASGCPCSSSSDGCAGCAPLRRASRPRSSGDGMSGLPNARSITSSPARRNCIFSASICANAYGGSALMRRNSTRCNGTSGSAPRIRCEFRGRYRGPMPAPKAVLLDVGGIFHLPDHDRIRRRVRARRVRR